MNLLANERGFKERRGFEQAREGEVVRLNAVAAHVTEVEDGGGEVAILDGAGD